MKIKEYLTNPVGKGSAIYPVRDMAKKMNDKYVLRKQKIKYKMYDVKGSIYFQFQIPSSTDGIYYDVIISFIKSAESGGVSILDMDFQIFSNCPSFVFTFCYSYNKRGLVLTDMQRNRTNKAIVESADTRNPYNLIGYEYSVYMALKHIVANNLINIEMIKKNSVKVITINKLIDNIQDFDSLMLRRDAKAKQNREKEKKDAKKLRIAQKVDVANLEETDVKHAATTEHVKEVMQQPKVASSNRTLTSNRTKSVKSTNRTKGVKKK
jgi:hypothetical protein